jgi:hypothetical protein
MTLHRHYTKYKSKTFDRGIKREMEEVKKSVIASKEGLVEHDNGGEREEDESER